MTRWYIGWNSKESSSLRADQLVTFRPYFDINTKHLKDVCVDLFEHDWEVFEDVLRNSKVEENIDTAHGKVVEEAEEVNADWDWRGKRCDKVGGIGRKSKGFVDDFKCFQLCLTEIQRKGEGVCNRGLARVCWWRRWRRWSEGSKRDFQLLDDIVGAGEDVEGPISGVICSYNRRSKRVFCIGSNIDDMCFCLAKYNDQGII